MLKFLLFFMFSSALAHDGAFHVFLHNFKGRQIHVYVPPGYERSSERFPVLYMHDGQNIYDPSRGFNGQTWKAEETLNALIKQNYINPLIVVAIDNSRNRTFDYTFDQDERHPEGGGADQYLEEVVQELIPQIEKSFRIKKGPKATGLMGSSLGGLVSLYGGVKYPHVFGLVGALSPSVWWNNQSILRVLRSARDLPEKVYIDSGTVGGERPQDVKKVFSLLSTRMSSGTLRVYIGEGDNHSEKAWAARFPYALIHLFGVKKIGRPIR